MCGRLTAWFDGYRIPCANDGLPARNRMIHAAPAARLECRHPMESPRLIVGLAGTNPASVHFCTNFLAIAAGEAVMMACFPVHSYKQRINAID